jgi:hypothetical protein
MEGYRTLLRSARLVEDYLSAKRWSLNEGAVENMVYILQLVSALGVLSLHPSVNALRPLQPHSFISGLAAAVQAVAQGPPVRR